MYCPNLNIYQKKDKYTSTKPYSPRLDGTIFSMNKTQLINITKNESHHIQTFVTNIDENKTLLDIYNNLSSENITIGKRTAIKNWFNKHGAEFYSLNILPEYSWIKNIGKGSFSTADLILHNSNFYVFKLTKLSVKPNDMKLAIREIDILKSINHPYIIKLFKYDFIHDHSYWSINDYCNLNSLTHYFNEISQPPTNLRYRFLQHITHALHYIHSKNIIHRDIKPQNIFLKGESYHCNFIVFKLGDFNLSRIINNQNTLNLSFCGTPCYMSPEVINKEEYNSKVDIWGLLCVYLEFIFNKPINPIIMSKSDLNNKLLSCNPFEITLIDHMHHIDKDLRPDINFIKSYIDSNIPKTSLMRQRSYSWGGI